MGVCTSRPAAHETSGAPTSTVDVREVLFSVKTLTGQTSVFVKKPYTEITYGDIKVALQKKEGFPVARQRLIFRGEEKSTVRLVSKDEVLKACCLHLVLKKK